MYNSRIVKSMSLAILMLAGSHALMAADAPRKQAQNEDTAAQDIRAEIASPLTGEFSQANEAMNWGSMQEDFGGTTGNSTGMDGFPTADSTPSSYPSPSF